MLTEKCHVIGKTTILARFEFAANAPLIRRKTPEEQETFELLHSRGQSGSERMSIVDHLVALLFGASAPGEGRPLRNE